MFDQEMARSGRLVTMAIVAFEHSCPASWPFDALYEALTWCYDQDMAIPGIFPVVESRQTAGYLVSPVDPEGEASEIFWRVMLDSESATETSDGYQFGDRRPFSVQHTAEGDYPIGLVGFVEPASSGRFPKAAVNAGIRELMDQPNWPTDLAVYPYPVFQGGSRAELGGLLLAPTADDLNDSSAARDIFRRIRDGNSGFNAHKHTPFPTKEFSA